MSPVNRRQLLAATAGGVAAALLPGQAALAALPSTPFAMGVASGDPTERSVVLWTRLAPDPIATDSGMSGQPDTISVHWRLATSAAGLSSDGTSLHHGNVDAIATDAWSVHVDVDQAAGGGALAADSRYFYQFTVPGWASPVGQTRTAPAPGTARPLRFAVVSCQNAAPPPGGSLYYNGYGDMLTRAGELDFVVHLGDYIYEFGSPEHVPDVACTEINHYRRRYGQYRMRSSLQSVHQRIPFFSVPDDHEYWNNVAGGDLPAARNGTADDAKVDRFNYALRAYWENMPIRGGRPVPAPDKRVLPLHRTIRWGSLLDMYLLDTRQYRRTTGGRTILGAAQRAELLDSIATSTATWTSLATSSPMTYFPEASSPDTWMGYDADRSALTDALAARRRSRPSFNPVVLSGDVHCGVVGQVRARQNTTSALVATEFIGPPMTSGSDRNWQALANRDPQGLQAFFSGVVGGTWTPQRGYLACSVTANAWESTYFVGRQMDDPNGKVTPQGTYRVTSGTIGARKVA
ncbi:alkaline phosphatase D family protein [Micromonospora sp. NPDC050397]|uniref:alkaline phosphatase D family protein n=1 Tax=Micromonospora sp. NPDC050397 TaxID=3364279 RepID=UPI00384AD2EC